MSIPRFLALGTAAALLVTLTSCQQNPSGSQTQPQEQALVLSDGQVTLDGQALTQDSQTATVSHDIVYYAQGQGQDYGEGTAQEEHSQEEAQAHTVVTIRQAGTYRLSGSLSKGQIAVDLGEGAKDDPDAVVTLILDNVDVTCTVAPALIFYNVYECGSTDPDQAGPQVDTSAAGANVILADGSENTFTGSHVARIYQEGTTEKLHKYDGAFYSKMSMNLSGETEETGVLNIVGDNEGLDSELHLTINGGTINIQSQDDGINTNEDGVSVTTINGGALNITAGQGSEGDGIDSNGYLVINGGSVYTTANERSADGGLDADCDILLNGGYVVALGVRNDAAAANSAQPYLECFFASPLEEGSQVALSDPQGNTLLSVTTARSAQCLTFSSADLALDTDYTLTVNGVVQQYTGHQSGGMGGPGGGMPGGDQALSQVPDDLESWLESAQDVPDDVRAWLEDVLEAQQGRPQEPPTDNGQQPQPPQDGQQPPQDDAGQSGQGGDQQVQPSTAFTITQDSHTFSGITDSAQDSGKTQVTFSAHVQVGQDGTVSVSQIQPSQTVDESHIRLTVTDVPSENYSASCLLSDGEEALAAILPTDPGSYQLTVAVTGDSQYTGAAQFSFTIPEPN